MGEEKPDHWAVPIIVALITALGAVTVAYVSKSGNQPAGHDGVQPQAPASQQSAPSVPDTSSKANHLKSPLEDRKGTGVKKGDEAPPTPAGVAKPSSVLDPSLAQWLGVWKTSSDSQQNWNGDGEAPRWSIVRTFEIVGNGPDKISGSFTIDEIPLNRFDLLNHRRTSKWSLDFGSSIGPNEIPFTATPDVVIVDEIVSKKGGRVDGTLVKLNDSQLRVDVPNERLITSSIFVKQ